MLNEKTKLKILYITNDDNVYGANRALLSLIEEVQKQNIVCEVLLSKNGPITEELNHLDVKHYTYKTCPWLCYESERRWKNLARIIFNKVTFWIISKKLKRECYDIIHTNSSVTNLGVYLSQKWNCKHVWHIREIPSACRLNYIYPDFYVKQQYASADKVLVISEYISRYYKKKLDYDATLQVIYDGVKAVEPKHKEHKIFSFCVVGIISEVKGQLYVCESIKSLVDRGIDNFICYIVGGIGEQDYYQKIYDFILRNHLEKNILLVGHTSNPQEYYEQSEVGIIASTSEGFGLVTVEYMLNELLVIGANAGATPELICDGVNGFLFEKENCDELADKMIWCMQNKEKVKVMGSESRKYAINSFGARENAEQVISVYKQLCMKKVEV